MATGKFQVDGTLVYYKILRPGLLKSSSDGPSSDSSPLDSTLRPFRTDFSDSEFMCRLIESKGSYTVSDLMNFLPNLFDPCQFQVFLKILMPLDHYLPGCSTPGLLAQLAELERPPSNGNAHAAPWNASAKILKEGSVVPFSPSNSARETKMEFLKDKLASLWVSGRKRGPLVWVAADMDQPVHPIDNAIYLKIYLSEQRESNKIVMEHGYVWKSVPKAERSQVWKPEVPPTGAPRGAERGPFSPPREPELPKDRNLDLRDEEELSSAGLKHSVTCADRDEIVDRVNRWSLTPDGRLKDVRSLLSTLQNVVCDDIDWEPMPLSLLAGDKDSIKKHYKRALLRFHPDKLQSKTLRSRLTCELIIQALVKSFNSSF